MRLLVKNIGTIVGIETAGRLRLCGGEMDRLETFDDAWLLSDNGRIAAFGSMDSLGEMAADEVVDAGGGMLLRSGPPGTSASTGVYRQSSYSCRAGPACPANDRKISLPCHCETSPQTGCGPDINRRVCRTHVPYAFGCNPYPHALALAPGRAVGAAD
mgnify:CR=1 FL=1